MDEYISREEAVKKIKSCIFTANDAWECGYNTAMGEITEMIKHIPAADVEPVRHGRWDELATFLICSKCKKPFKYQYSYCPNCGAKMDGDANG